MNEEELINQLRSPDPSLRFQAVSSLRFNYSPEVGDALTDALIAETADGVWWLLALAVVPLWLPTLDSKLNGHEQWPFGSARTLKIFSLAHRYPFHSFDRHADAWALSDDWVCKFAAFRHIRSEREMEDGYRIAKALLADIDSFEVSSDYLLRYFWIEEFSNRESRRSELVEFLEEECGIISDSDP